jgi:hypothetical protein
MTQDPSLTLARPDLADARLEGVVRAERYAPAIPKQAAAPVASIHAAASTNAPAIDQLAFGEVFDLLEAREGWGWGQKRRSGVVGYVELQALAEPVLRPTHLVSAPETPARAQPDKGATVVALYEPAALVTVEEQQAGFARAARSGWLPERALLPIAEAETGRAA